MRKRRLKWGLDKAGNGLSGVVAFLFLLLLAGIIYFYIYVR